ncbi:MAG: amidohydrolase family protein [Solobacterium sp.]|nr:amidohydrolase family protein [Solobacterium sp.]
MASGFINGILYGRQETGFYVDDQRFVRFGSDAEIRKLLTETDDLTDLDGGFVLPGFISIHMHMLKNSRENASLPAEEALAAYGIRMNKAGITAAGSEDFTEPGWEDGMDLFMRLAYQGRLHVRVSEQCRFRDERDYAAFLDEGYGAGIGDELFTAGPLHLVMNDESGVLSFTDEEAETLVRLAGQFNTPVLAEVSTPAALDQILAVFRDTMLPGNPLGDAVLCGEKVHPDQLDEIRRLGLYCAMPAGSAKDPYVLPYMPADGTAPLAMIASAADKEGTDGAIEALTAGAARFIGMGSDTGQLQEGYLADFVVLDRDITACAADEISSAQIRMTVLGGEAVYEK